MSGEVNTKPPITATIIITAPITIFADTSAFVLGRLRVFRPGCDIGKLIVSLNMKLKATPAMSVDIRCAGK